VTNALIPHHQPRVDRLELEAHRLHQLHSLTGDPILEQMTNVTDKLTAEFRGRIQ
jgi:hypothetical protein